MHKLGFEHTELLYLLAAIPVLVLLFVVYRIWRRRSLRMIGDEEVAGRLIRQWSAYKGAIKFVLLLFAFAFLVLAAANLRIGSKIEKVKREGVDVVIALDLSRSMLAEDIKPFRLEYARQFIYQLLARFENDRIGLVVFAGRAYVQMPLTIDYAAAKLFLSELNTEMIPTQGTAIGEAIEMSKQLFVEGEKKYKVLVIISDGENHEDDAIEAAKQITKEGVTVFTIGVGSQTGAPIPVYAGGVQVDYKKDKSGSIVLSKINESALREIAEKGNGHYYRLSSSGVALNSLLKELVKIEKKELDSRVFTEYISKFQLFLAIALFFLIADFFIFERKNKWRINLFNFRQERTND